MIGARDKHINRNHSAFSNIKLNNHQYETRRFSGSVQQITVRQFDASSITIDIAKLEAISVYEITIKGINQMRARMNEGATLRSEVFYYTLNHTQNSK